MALSANTSRFKCGKLIKQILHINRRYASARSAEAIFIQKSIEEPILVVTERENVDMIGPPDATSNLRPVLRKRLLHETHLQQKLRELQDSTHDWNHKFWSIHNTRFLKERQNYIDGKQAGREEKSTLTADEMSEFYKKFLDDNWKTHVTYNFEWYKKNFALLLLAFRTQFEFGRS